MHKNRIILYTAMALISLVSCNEGKNASQTENKNDTRVSADSIISNPVQIDSIYVDNAPSGITRAILQDKQGDIWIVTFKGVFRYDGKTFTNVMEGISSARFFSLLEDRQGNLWFGSIGSGAYRYSGETFQNFTTKDGLLNNEVGSMYEDKAGNIWFGVSGGASRYDGTSFKNYTINEDVMNEASTDTTFSERQPYEVTSIIEDNTGKFWFGTRGNAFVYDGENFNSLNQSGKPFINIRTLIEDANGNIWTGGNDGLWRFDGSTFTNVTTDFVGYIYEDSHRNIWTSSHRTNAGWVLSRYEVSTSKSERYTITEIDPKSDMTFGIFEDDEGTIWVGTLNGVFIYDGTSVKYFRTREG